MAARPQQSFSDPLEGYYGSEGFVPYGFFPHQWDTVERRPKESRMVLASALDEFKLFFDVRADAAQAEMLLTFMRDGRFLDGGTAAVDVEMVTYNADSSMFASVRFTFQVERTGGISWDYSIRAVDSGIDRGPLLVALEVLAIACLGVSMLVEGLDFARAVAGLSLWEYATSPFNWLDLSGFTIQCLAWAKWYEILSRCADLQLEGRGDYEVLVDPFGRIRPFRTDPAEELALLRLIDNVAAMADLQVQYSSLTGIVVVVLTFKVVKSLDFQPRMGLITRTLARAGSNLAHFTALFLLIFFSYAFVGHVMFGPNLPAMSTFPGALRSLGYILLNFDPTQFHAQMRHAVQREGDGGASVEYEVYVWTFVFVCVFILLNILLAILVAGYTDIAESSYTAGSVVGDLCDCLSYWACCACFPVTRFISDEQLSAHLNDELAMLRGSTDTRCGSSSGARNGELDEKARMSAEALDTREAILLGRGRCLDERDTRALILSLLARHTCRRTASAGGSAKEFSWAVKDRRRSSLGACVPAEGSAGDAAPRTNHLVVDLLRRYGEDVAELAGDAARDARALLELEGQGRLLRLEKDMIRLQSRVGLLESGLASVAAATNAAAAAATKAAAAAEAAAAVVEHVSGDLMLGDSSDSEDSGRRGFKRCRLNQSARGGLLSQKAHDYFDSKVQIGARAGAILAPVPCGPVGLGPRRAEKGTDSEGAEEEAENFSTDQSLHKIETTSVVQRACGFSDAQASTLSDKTSAYNGINEETSLGQSELARIQSTGQIPAGSGDCWIHGTLQVMVVSARGLPRMDVARSCDPYCLIFVQGQTHSSRSPQVTRTSLGQRPIWEERFSFDISAVERTRSRLVVAVWDHDVVSADDLIGSTCLELADLADGVVSDDWFPLRGPGLQGRSGRAAAVRLRALFRPLVTAQAKHPVGLQGQV